jgi:pimeloyl-ACP methyl ester carboxylesterase
MAYAVFGPFRQGGRGPAWELYLFTRRWDIDASRVPTETLLWHGEADRTVPPAMGRRYAALIPRCRARFLPEEGHFSLPVHHAAEILGELVRD